MFRQLSHNQPQKGHDYGKGTLRDKFMDNFLGICVDKVIYRLPNIHCCSIALHPLYHNR